ncbi:MAG: DNA primase small subunit domain-containing protein [Candidatus Nitrosocaldaceae archaeon]
MDSIDILKRAFRRYYFDKFDTKLDRIKEREFGYATFDNRVIRHISFNDKNELRALLVREIPADVYASNAYYTNPEAEIELKNWLAADLIFDIDIKDLALPCMKDHQFSICINCKDISNEKICLKCRSNTKEVNIPCNNCIEEGKHQVFKILEMLNELGANKISVYFSGNNGFHIHVNDEELSYLNSEARRDIADYIKGIGIIPDIFGMGRKKNIDHIKDALNSEKGWKGRIARELLSRMDRNRLISSLRKKSYENFNNELRDITKRLGVTIDTVVTIDTHRIFRLENTLSSKSGLAKIKIDDVSQFNPYEDAVFIDDEPTKVHIHYAPKLLIKGNSFGPYKDEIVSLPLYAAVYLICKGLASEPKVLN